MATTSRPDHDALYHRLFSVPGVVAQLLRAFVGGPGGADIDLDDLDLDGMERLNAKFHADTGQRREGDMIWCIPRRDGADTYLVLLLEFQSTSDQYMALRVLTYAGLLWQQLVAERRLVSDGKLPPLLPVVLYNGDARWRAPAAVRDLVGLPEASRLWRWQPDLLYHLIDASTFSTADLAARDGLPALWFRLERADDPAQVVAIADGLIAWLGRHSGFSDARRVFVELLSAVMARSGVGPQAAEDFLDMRSRLLERAEQWQREWRLEGLEKGLQQGLQEGREKGLQEGRQEGRQEGLHEGRKAGREEGREQGREEGRLEGEAALLLRLLERRFGLLPDWAVDRVRASNIAMLDEWGMRLLDAESLDEVLEAPSG